MLRLLNCHFAANEEVYGWRPQAIWICALLAAAPSKGRKQSSGSLWGLGIRASKKSLRV